jgi:predicted phosphoadenosine phosphosulfate sulfurtransferase
MKIYLNQSVLDAAKERISYIMDEFENVGVWFSGGKDSTVTLELTLQVAEEKGRLPVPVCFVDQEAEWGAVVEYTRRVMSDPRVDPYWLQVPIKLFNAASMDDPWLRCWEEGEEWMRPKEPNSIKDNVYGTDRFYPMFQKFLEHHYPSQPAAFLGGVRAEESPNRAAGLTTGQTYKHVTWGKVQNHKLAHYTFYPLYDWGYRDIWKTIHDCQWDYCTIYNEYYRYGLQPMKMRVSNLHHETAVDQLFYLQELESDTWDRLTKRLKGINQARHMLKKDMFSIKDLPYMFSDWAEYRDYLVDHLIQTDERQELFRKKFASMDEKFSDMALSDERHKSEVLCILANDYHFVKLSNFLGRPETINFLKFKRGKDINWSRPDRDLRYIKKEQRGES